MSAGAVQARLTSPFWLPVTAARDVMRPGLWFSDAPNLNFKEPPAP